MRRNHLSLYEELEVGRQHLFKKLDSLDESVLAFIPAQNQWSILQICYHLIKSEELSLAYVNKKLQYKSNIFPASLGSFFRSTLLYIALYMPFRLHAPERVSEFPENLEWAKLKSQWKNIRNEFKQLFENLPPEYENKLLCRHPAAGRMTLHQTLLFFRIHINRHEKQIYRIIRANQKKD